MKTKSILLLALISLGSLTLLAQNDPDVSSIRSGVLRTNKLLKTFKKTTKMVEGVSLEGTEATFYTSTAGLKKIHAEMAGETYYAKADYYYSDRGELTFIYYQFNRYDTQIGMTPPPKVVKVEEKRLYFKNNKLIKRINTITETGENIGGGENEKEILDLEKTFRKAEKS
ncbi:MAG: hypothetical protein HKN25_13085 [Pyrinomonadaceae bacterium]|nr:hypothetical protein [Pyrinomonadaceae bacterium]